MCFLNFLLLTLVINYHTMNKILISQNFVFVIWWYNNISNFLKDSVYPIFILKYYRLSISLFTHTPCPNLFRQLIWTWVKSSLRPAKIYHTRSFQLILFPSAFCSFTLCRYQYSLPMPFIIHPRTYKSITILIPAESLVPASLIPKPFANILFIMTFPSRDISACVFPYTFS